MLKPISLQYFRINRRFIGTSLVRNHWNKHYKPGPFPDTEEAKEKAAKKYGILLEDYKTYPDDGRGFGDYPKCNETSAESRELTYPWDKPEWAHNYKETINVDEQLMDYYHYDLSRKHRVPFWSQWGQFLFAMGLTFGMLGVSSQFKMFLPLFPRQYPNEVHYYFETEETGKKKRAA